MNDPSEAQEPDFQAEKSSSVTGGSTTGAAAAQAKIPLKDESGVRPRDVGPGIPQDPPAGT